MRTCGKLTERLARVKRTHTGSGFTTRTVKRIFLPYMKPCWQRRSKPLLMMSSRFWAKGKAYFPSSVLSRQNSTSRNYECSWTDMGQNIHAQYLFLCQETWYRGVRPSSWQDNKGVWGKALILPENWHQEVLSLNQSQCDERLIRRKIKDADLLWLLDEIIDSAQGLPIGNYLSQYLANLYLCYFMHWVNECLPELVRKALNLKEKPYIKAIEYADDIPFLAESKDVLHQVSSS